MLDWLIGTLVTAFPFLLPIIIHLIGRIVGYRWPVQRLLVSVALAFYSLALMVFAAHAWTVGLGAQEFFNAFYGKPVDRSMLVMCGYGLQTLAIVALLFCVNWRVIRLFYGEDDGMTARAKTTAASGKEDAEKSAETVSAPAADDKKN